jgi:hypothetical protein
VLKGVNAGKGGKEGVGRTRLTRLMTPEGWRKSVSADWALQFMQPGHSLTHVPHYNTLYMAVAISDPLSLYLSGR